MKEVWENVNRFWNWMMDDWLRWVTIPYSLPLLYIPHTYEYVFVTQTKLSAHGAGLWLSWAPLTDMSRHRPLHLCLLCHLLASSSSWNHPNRIQGEERKKMICPLLSTSSWKCSSHHIGDNWSRGWQGKVLGDVIPGWVGTFQHHHHIIEREWKLSWSADHIIYNYSTRRVKVMPKEVAWSPARR